MFNINANHPKPNCESTHWMVFQSKLAGVIVFKIHPKCYLWTMLKIQSIINTFWDRMVMFLQQLPV